MHPRIAGAVIALAAWLLPAAGRLSAATIDGRLDPQYGPALSIQTTQTSQADAIDGQLDFSGGSELDAAYGYIENGTLYLFFSGNLMFLWDLEGQTLWLPLDIFIDSTPGGQNALLSNNPAPDPFAYNLNNLAGLTFDSGFAADYWLSLGGNGGTWPRLQAYEGALPSAGGGAGAFLGSGSCGGPGTLSGGSNPDGIQVTLDDRNVSGVTSGCGAASGAGVTTGAEWAIPLAAIGNPSGCVKVCAFVSFGDHSQLFNQVLGPLPAGTCNLGVASAVNFASIPGDQFFTVCPGGATPARHATWGSLKSIYR